MLESNQIMIITFCSFSACGLLFSFYLVCQHKIAENREKNIVKINRVKPVEFTYTLEYPQTSENLQNSEKFEETKDERENNFISNV